MAMIKVFSEHLFRKVSAIQTRENRPLDCFAEQSLKKSKLKNPCSQVWIDQPENTGRHTSDMFNTILMFMFHSMGGGMPQKREGGGILRSIHQARYRRTIVPNYLIYQTGLTNKFLIGCDE